MTEGSTTDSTKRPQRPVVVPLPAKRTLRPEHLANLRESGLTDETIALAELYSEANRKTLADLVQRSGWPTHCGSAIVFPFYLPGATEPHAYRVRPSNPRIGRKGKPIKYDQAEAYGSLVYFPPRARSSGAYADITRPAYWTEGEKKTLKLDELGYVVVGLTGVNQWHDVAYKETTGGERLHPQIAQYVTIPGREHVIVFDADAGENDKVMRAAQHLAGVLLAAGATSVRFVTPPDAATAKGIDDYAAAHGDAATRALLETAGPIEPADPKQPLPLVRKLKAYRDAPLPEWLRMPPGYDLRRDGSLWYDDERVTGTPLFVTRELYHATDRDERVELAFGVDDQWRTLRVSRKAICDARTLVAEVAPFGGRVTSNNAGKLVDWFDALVEANVSQLPRTACVESTGWHRVADAANDNGGTIFMLAEPHGPGGAGNSGSNIVLDARGDVVTAFAALKPRGDRLDALEQHTAALKRAWHADPIAATVVCAAFAAPLLEPLGAANFGVHLPGESSRGKSSMLKIAASVYGDPENKQWLTSWDATGASIELRAARFNHLPQCYDEVGARGDDARAAEKMVYALINGVGRTRATRDLTVRATRSWHTILLSTGERELADEASSTGAQVRCVQLPVRGFGELTGEQVDELRDACRAFAGHAGRAWVGQLVTVDDWAPYRELLALATRDLRAQARDPLQGRVAAYYAVLVVCEVMLAAELGIGDDNGATMRAAFHRFATGRESPVGVAERARELVEHWAYSDPDAFPALEQRSGGGDDLVIANTRSGKARHGFMRDRVLYVFKTSFDSYLKSHGLEPRVVIREWLARGETEVDSDGRLAKRVRIGANSPRCVVLKPPTNEVNV
jgi:hypothetical protein